MRGFMILCLVAVAIAAPQYNYQQGAASGGGGAQQGGFAGQAGYGGQAGAAGGSFGGQGAATGGGFGGQGGDAGGRFGGQQAGGFGQSTGGAPSFAGTAHQAAPVQAVYNKQFFIHSAPEEDASQGAGSSDEQATLRKNLRVVIVRAPENRGLTDAALQLAKSASEDKTVVYVLNKQTDLNELQNQLSQIQESNPNKPEVHFVKYKTPEEAEHAQHSIQAQYDSFGGPTQVSDEGVAPVQSFIGSAGPGGIAGGNGGGFAGSASNQFGGSPSVQNSYLPASQRF